MWRAKGGVANYCQNRKVQLLLVDISGIFDTKQNLFSNQKKTCNIQKHPISDFATIRYALLSIQIKTIYLVPIANNFSFMGLNGTTCKSQTYLTTAGM